MEYDATIPETWTKNDPRQHKPGPHDTKCVIDDLPKGAAIWDNWSWRGVVLKTYEAEGVRLHFEDGGSLHFPRTLSVYTCTDGTRGWSSVDASSTFISPQERFMNAVKRFLATLPPVKVQAYGGFFYISDDSGPACMIESHTGRIFYHVGDTIFDKPVVQKSPKATKRTRAKNRRPKGKRKSN